MNFSETDSIAALAGRAITTLAHKIAAARQEEKKIKHFFNGWTDEKINAFLSAHIHELSCRTSEDINGGYIIQFSNGETYDIRYKYRDIWMLESRITINGQIARIIDHAA